MESSGSEELPQAVEMRDRLISKESGRMKHIEDQTLDLDARTLALLGKRQRLRVNHTATTYLQIA